MLNQDQHRQSEEFQVTPEIERRSFLQAGLASAGTMLATSVLPGPIASAALPQQLTSSPADQIPRRPFGKTGEQISIIGLGGYHLGSVQSADLAVRLVQEAVDAGITFFDNAWEYNDHRSEEWMGLGLQGRRDKVFLMSKACTHGRDKNVAMQQLEESLKRLGTDHLDLWQIHEVIYENDPDLHFAKGGVVEALDEAKKQGKVRFVGFTGHKKPEIHLKMLAHDYPFDSVQMPLNCFDATYRSFEQRVLPELQRRGIAALGMKSLGGDGQPVQYGVVRAEEALRYAMVSTHWMYCTRTWELHAASSRCHPRKCRPFVSDAGLRRAMAITSCSKQQKNMTVKSGGSSTVILLSLNFPCENQKCGLTKGRRVSKDGRTRSEIDRDPINLFISHIQSFADICGSPPVWHS
jgi:aryl-alcohol dehydrogenase-like predicted oxidoreductase